jgi:hypothetical protein
VRIGGAVGSNVAWVETGARWLKHVLTARFISIRSIVCLS